MKAAPMPLELSDARFSPPGWRYASALSPHLKGRGDVLFWAPPKARGPLPLLILLHGAWSSHWAWALKGGAIAQAQRLIRQGRIRPLALALPTDGNSGEGSLYAPRKDGRDAGAWVAEEVPALAARVLPGTRGTRRYLAGLSMGGFGALRLAAAYPGRFSGVAAHSALINADEVHLDPRWGDLKALALRGPRRRLLPWLKAAPSLPPLRFDCGRQDAFFKANVRLHADLERAGIAHRFRPLAGGHTWPYWRARLAEDLLYFDALERAHQG